MNSLWIIPYYLSWHYTTGLKNIFNLWKDFSWFTTRFFSFSNILRTFFYPFKRMSERVIGKGFQSFLESILVNISMIIIGIILRSFLIVVGLASLLVVLILAMAFAIFWATLPLLIGLTFIYSLKDLFEFFIL